MSPTKVRGRAGRAETLIQSSRFWFEVAHGVTAATTAAFIITWVGSAVVLASQGGAGSDVNWELAISWSFAYVLLGVALVSLGVTVYAAVDYAADITRHRGALIVAVGCSWALALSGMIFVPERNTDGAIGFVFLTFVLLTAASLVVASATNPPAGESRDWTETFWRITHLGLGIAVGLVATTMLALALGSIYQRTT